MEDIIKESYTKNSPIPVSIKGTEKILTQMRESVCKIYNHKINGTGFFCKLPYKAKLLPFLITNNHILNSIDIKYNKIIKISLNNETEFKKIKLDQSRIIYTNEKLDVTLIEIIPCIDNINEENCLEIDDNINIEEKYEKKSIYVLHYPKEEDILVSYGLTSYITGKQINHISNTDNGSSGAPILLLKNFKVIGIHYGSKDHFNFNKGVLIKYVILELNKLNEMTIIYDNKENKMRIRIFGDMFVKNNKNNCKLIINNKEEELCTFINTDNKNKIKIKLKEINIINNMSYMFSECSTIIDLPEISIWDTSNIVNVCGMFYFCSSLISLPDISKFNTSNITNMGFMFRNCSSLKYLPDISNWDTSNITNMNCIFSECSTLISLPDISGWNTSNVEDMASMFRNCSSLKFLPDISKWNTSNVNNMELMFYKCSSLNSLPDISNWNTSKVEQMSGIFSGCSSLINLPDISKWDISNVKYMTNIFRNCSSLKFLPNINIWNTSNIIDKKGMFIGCNSLNIN